MTGHDGDREPRRAGVIGVGSMGRHHARVYSELPGIDLVGVCDADDDRARAVSDRYGTRARSRSGLLETAEMVSIAVPTPHHYGVARECLDRGVHALVEKPLVDDLEDGADLVERARRADVVLQVGHVERFNPAVGVLEDLVADLDLIACDFRRLGPPVERELADGVVLDLMVHDLDILRSLAGGELVSLAAVSARDDQFAHAQLRFDSGLLASLTASRVTQQRVRELSVTAVGAHVNVDFGDQSVELHRQSRPEYVEVDGEVQSRYSSVVERPMVPNGEPLKHELEAFADAVREGREPDVTAADGLAVLELAKAIEEAAAERTLPTEVTAR